MPDVKFVTWPTYETKPTKPMLNIFCLCGPWVFVGLILSRLVIHERTLFCDLTTWHDGRQRRWMNGHEIDRDWHSSRDRASLTVTFSSAYNVFYVCVCVCVCIYRFERNTHTHEVIDDSICLQRDRKTHKH